MSVARLRALTRAVGNLRPWLFSADSRLVSTSSNSCSDEVEKAKAATSTSNTDTVFSKIIKKEIPADVVHEDDKVRYHASANY